MRALRLSIGLSKKLLSIILMLGFVSPALAIDNPDAPDYIAQFEERAKPFETKISKSPNDHEIKSAQADYEKFLDAELNDVYSKLTKKLKDKNKKQLKESQRKWISFRDSEFTFVDENWTDEQFGTSSAISRGDYHNSLVKQRVLTLLGYLKNY